MQARVDELEIRLGLAQDHLDELNHALFRQQEKIDLLQAQMRELCQMVQPAGPGRPEDPRDEIPPHY